MVAVVLLGAGASFGSRDVLPEVPPLGASLFAKLEARGGVAATISEDLKDLFRKDFEAGMAEYAHRNGSIAEFQRELARYLADFIPGPQNVYRRLISKLGVDNVIYCSLNYDLLLEQSAAACGCVGISYNIDRPGNRFIRILKPHGSSNIWPDIPANVNIRAVDCGIDIEAPVQILSRRATIERCASEGAIAPSMSMFAIGKAVKVCSSWVQTQQARWRDAVEVASRIFVVGVRVHEVDTHIWEVLGQSEAPLTYFGVTANDESEFDRWKRNAEKKNARFQKADFAESVSFMRMEKPII